MQYSSVAFSEHNEYALDVDYFCRSSIISVLRFGGRAVSGIRGSLRWRLSLTL